LLKQAEPNPRGLKPLAEAGRTKPKGLKAPRPEEKRRFTVSYQIQIRDRLGNIIYASAVEKKKKHLIAQYRRLQARFNTARIKIVRVNHYCDAEPT
jgi:hypothetical protein